MVLGEYIRLEDHGVDTARDLLDGFETPCLGAEEKVKEQMRGRDFDRVLPEPPRLFATGSQEAREALRDQLYQQGRRVGLAPDPREEFADRGRLDQRLLEEVLNTSGVAYAHWQEISRLLSRYQEVARAQGEDPLLVSLQVRHDPATRFGADQLAYIEVPSTQMDVSSGTSYRSLPVFLYLSRLEAARQREGDARVFIEGALHNELADLEGFLTQALFLVERGVPSDIAFGAALNTTEISEALLYAVDNGVLLFAEEEIPGFASLPVQQRIVEAQRLLNALSPDQQTRLLAIINRLAERADTRYAGINEYFSVSPLSTESSTTVVYGYRRNGEILNEGRATLAPGSAKELSMTEAGVFPLQAQRSAEQVVERQLRLYGLDRYFSLAPHGGTAGGPPGILPLLVQREPNVDNHAPTARQR